ncbi:MAG: Gfo/Idh/MocA family oxidoreductase [Verrucomicrobiota bacterium]
MQNFTSQNKTSQTRRGFIKTGTLAGAAIVAAPYLLRAQAERKKLNIACIGAGGKGQSDTDGVAKENIIALCDPDKRILDGRQQKYPNVKVFQDYRKMFEAIGKDLDAVTVSTPDHHHAIASALAMQMGKHVFCQKPLVQTVYEARVLRKLAREKKLATQMGNQGSAGPGLRRAVEVIQAGVIGPVRELHVWSNRPIWPQGVDRPEGEDPIPAELDWDVWIGPAQMRPFKNKVYHPFAWRGWFDFGTGALGDMACHTVNMPFRALKLGYPTKIECEDVFGAKPETYPKSSRIRFEFPEREGQVPVKFWWYDGDPKSQTTFRPDQEKVKEILDMQAGKLPGSGCLLIGDKGKIFSPDDYGSKFYLKLKDEAEYTGGDKHAAAQSVPQTIPRSPGHVQEWIDMIHGGAPAYSNYEIAAYLTEIILLGCIALRHGTKKPIEWDGPNAKAKNADVSHLVKRNYRKGWDLV